MKQLGLIVTLAGLVVVFVAAAPQEKQKIDPQKRAQLMEMMNDPATMGMMMDRVASNRQMGMMMMQKMIKHAHADSSMMNGMCRMLIDDQPMHSMMMNMMGGGMMNRGGMMNDDGMMHGNSAERDQKQ